MGTLHLDTRKASSTLLRSLCRNRRSRRRAPLYLSRDGAISGSLASSIQGTEDSDTPKCFEPLAQTMGGSRFAGSKLLALEPKLRPDGGEAGSARCS